MPSTRVNIPICCCIDRITTLLSRLVGRNADEFEARWTCLSRQKGFFMLHGTQSAREFGLARNHPQNLLEPYSLMSGPSDVANALQGLGNSADEVATVLKIAGIRGVRNTVRLLNPIVRFVEMQVKDTWNLNISSGDSLSMNFRSGGKGRVALPEAVKQFLHAFNHGAYAELEMPIEP